MELDKRLRGLVTAAFIDLGRAPTSAELAERAGATPAEVEDALRRLEARHTLTLRPGTSEIWTAPPFSATPTLHLVVCPGGSFFGACAWCALGAAVLGGLPARVRSRSGGEDRELQIEIDENGARPSEVCVHFAVPASRWAESLSYGCSTILFFGSEQEVDPWCARRGITRGQVLSLDRTLSLARAWFTERPGQAVFDRLGLTDPFWRL